jgi:NADH-quinone oxidoreductase subunit E
MADNKATMTPLSDASRQEIDHWLTKYPAEQKQSAVIPALSIVQEENGGHLTEGLMNAVAAYLDMPQVSVYEVANFYSMYDREPCGRYKINLCTNISCMLMGAEDIVSYVEKKLGIKLGETSPDGKFTLKIEEECLAACNGGPMMALNGHYYEKLTPEKIDEILDGLE